MALADGTRLGPYEILSPIGAGGMGEVYRAKDTKLGREVAIKVLPEVFSRNRERLARFQREARLLASLNHPNIAAIHELEESDGKPFLVLEFVQGENLQERLKKGALEVEEGLEVCRQVAAGLEAAHEKGVIHRDLKPANVMITSEGNVKVLDFGLAKVFAGEVSESEEAHSPTITQGQTREGVILGTASYMSPEQARGRSVDKRTDIWSFGCLLYEVLTGRRAYEGPTVSDNIAQILVGDPDWDALPAKLHPRIVELLRRCLQKDSAKRRRDIGDLRLEIEEALADPGGLLHAPVSDDTPMGWRRAIILVLAASLVVGAMVGIAVWNLKPPPPEKPRRVARFDITPPETAPLSISSQATDVAISPDGTHVAYRSKVGNRIQLYLSSVGQFDATPIRGAEDIFVSSPFFSPDGSEIAFFTPGPNELKKLSIEGGVPVTLTTLPFASGCWGPDGSIILGSPFTGLFRLAKAGVEPEPLTTPDSEKGETGHQSPETLPNGKAVLFAINTGQDRQIAVLDLETKDYEYLGISGSYPHYSPTGHIVYVLNGALWAVAFDLNSLAITGSPVAVLENVNTDPVSGAANFTLSDEGSLLYVPSMSSSRQLVWVDREGKEEPIDTESRQYERARISPDGQRVVVAVRDANNTDLWVRDLRLNTETRLTRDPGLDSFPIWTPNGKRIVFHSQREAAYGLYWKRADGTGTVDLLMRHPGATASDWSADGQLVFMDGNIGMLSMEGEGKGRKLISGEFRVFDPAVSPNGRWIAYTSMESGQYEIYARPFPNVDEGKWSISSGGGNSPAWSPDGTELFYRNGNKMMVVEITTETGFSYGAAKELFEGTYSYGDGTVRNYDIHPGDKRFLMIKELGQVEPQLIFVQNWSEELKRLVPTDN